MPEPMIKAMNPSRVLLQEQNLSPEVMRKLRGALTRLDLLMEPQYAITQRVLERIAIDLPRAMAEGSTNILQLVVRFHPKKFEVLYVGIDGTETVWPQSQTLSEFDPIMMVRDFSKSFGWVEDLQLDHEKKLEPEQREQLRHIVEDIATIEAHLPRRLYLSLAGRVRKSRPKEGLPMDLRIDVVLSKVSYWLAYYQLDDGTKDGMVARFGVFFNSVIPPPPLGYWHRYRLTGLDLIANMMDFYGIDLQKPLKKR